MTAEPFTVHWEADVLRVLVAAFALWMGVLILRLGVRRWRDQRRGIDDRRTDPFVYWSYAVALFSIVADRIHALGHPPDYRLAMAIAVLTLGIIGVRRRVHIPLRPPWTRR